MKVKKYSGELEVFNPASLKNSLIKSGASPKQVEAVYEHILEVMYDGIPTVKLYQYAFDFLKKERNSFAARYSLKKALRDLGPNGFYFEKWVCHLFAYLGFETTNNLTLQGHAVTHEIDVLASANNTLHIIECKLRNDVDAKISVTTPMYFLSRWKDVSNKTFHYFGKDMDVTQGWLVTNAYLTKDSIAFGEHYGIKLLAWDYPANRSLKNLVDLGAIYPITCMTTISDHQKVQLLDANCVLVKDILTHKELLQKIVKSSEKMEDILEEAQELTS